MSKIRNLDRYTSIGCYPLFYFDKDGSVFCVDCANDASNTANDREVNWEDPSLFCDECNKRIESAYADDPE